MNGIRERSSPAGWRVYLFYTVGTICSGAFRFRHTQAVRAVCYCLAAVTHGIIAALGLQDFSSVIICPVIAHLDFAAVLPF